MQRRGKGTPQISFLPLSYFWKAFLKISRARDEGYGWAPLHYTLFFLIIFGQKTKSIKVVKHTHTQTHVRTKKAHSYKEKMYGGRRLRRAHISIISTRIKIFVFLKNCQKRFGLVTESGVEPSYAFLLWKKENYPFPLEKNEGRRVITNFILTLIKIFGLFFQNCQKLFLKFLRFVIEGKDFAPLPPTFLRLFFP